LEGNPLHAVVAEAGSLVAIVQKSITQNERDTDQSLDGFGRFVAPVTASPL
jgi:hypothetical protein